MPEKPSTEWFVDRESCCCGAILTWRNDRVECAECGRHVKVTRPLAPPTFVVEP